LLLLTAVQSAATAPLLLGAHHAAINRYLLPAGPTAANPLHAAATVNSWHRQMDSVLQTLPQTAPAVLTS